ncbi:MAG TPA: diaminopimelate decarboxylase [Actinomycetota bacterium]|jgi:diaminopimelate decarboxylase
MPDPSADRPRTAVVDGESPWPATATFGEEGLTIGGARAADLADRFGTPLLVIDEEDLRARMRAAARAYPRVLYAVKAFLSRGAIRIALDEGLDLLASTGGEIEACRRAGAPASRIWLHGRNKTDRDLDLAVREGIGAVIADDTEDLRRLDAAARDAGVRVGVLLRIVPEVAVQTHEKIATGHEASTFGIPRSQVLEAAGLADASPALELRGLHLHLGSQIGELQPYLRAMDVALALLREIRDSLGVSLGVLDLGGGFGVSYTGEAALRPEEVAAPIRGHLGAACRELGVAEPELAVEPGRSLVSNPAVTLYRVGTRKASPDGGPVVAVDGGMSDNIRPALYGARYAVASAGPVGAVGLRETTIVGSHCESGDVLADGVRLPADVGRGDLIAFAATGAYTYSLASNYNRVGRPAVVAVRGGEVTPWLRREDAADLDRLELSPRPADRPSAPPDGIEIRPALPRDARSYLAFWRAIVAEGRAVRTESVTSPVHVYRARFRRSWTDREAQIVALDGRRVVGHVYVQRELHPVTRHVATLGIAVAADRRSRGIGGALMAEAIRWGRSVGVEKLMLSVYPSNAAAIALYRRFGFVDEGRLVRHSRKSYGYEDEVLMATWIGPEPTG